MTDGEAFEKLVEIAKNDMGTLEITFYEIEGIFECSYTSFGEPKIYAKRRTELATFLKEVIEKRKVKL